VRLALMHITTQRNDAIDAEPPANRNLKRAC
jgi:hypothetical protein